jgi:hypothetical protein
VSQTHGKGADSGSEKADTDTKISITENVGMRKLMVITENVFISIHIAAPAQVHTFSNRCHTQLM